MLGCKCFETVAGYSVLGRRNWMLSAILEGKEAPDTYVAGIGLKHCYSWLSTIRVSLDNQYCSRRLYRPRTARSRPSLPSIPAPAVASTCWSSIGRSSMWSVWYCTRHTISDGPTLENSDAVCVAQVYADAGYTHERETETGLLSKSSTWRVHVASYFRRPPPEHSRPV
jgi:hypothetical protein